jgi:hypothetical protein
MRRAAAIWLRDFCGKPKFSDGETLKTTVGRRRVHRLSAKARHSGYDLLRMEKRNSHEVAKASSRGREPTVEFSDYSLALKGRQRAAEVENRFR